MTERMFENGMNVSTAGKTTNARSGPASGISLMGIPERVEI